MALNSRIADGSGLDTSDRPEHWNEPANSRLYRTTKVPSGLLPAWFDDVAACFPEPSAGRYRLYCGRYLAWCHNTHTDPLRCGPRKIADYRQRLVEGDPKHVPLRAGTVRNHLTAIRCMYRLVEEQGLIPPGFRDPARHIRLPRYVPGPQPRATDMQRRRLLDQADQAVGPMRNRNRAILGVLVYVVPRADELVTMPLGAYSNPFREVATLQWVVGKGDLRAARIPRAAAAAVEQWLREREDIAAELRSAGLPVADRLFITRNGRPLPPRYVYKLVIDLGRLAGLPHLPPHSFRRGAMREGRKNGVPTDVLQRFVGWQDATMVDRYAGEQAVPYDQDPGLLAYERDEAARAVAVGFPISTALDGSA